ncbi:hypothetical protein K440DRAFT_663722 [Wilcoxina mikolae CBS 423.85]|nr:hypothetical protein K440DRAFT_663722 [Wilcoxina mikolae CBS 423.85]
MPSGHQETIAPLLFKVELGILAISIIVVCGRFYSRSRILYAVGIDDWCILSAGFGLVAMVCLHTTMAAYGSGRHLADVPLSDARPRYAIGSVSRLIYLPTAALIRISVMLFMRKLSLHRMVQYTTFVLISINIFVAAFLFLFQLLQCTPAHVFFEPHPQRGPYTCLVDELMVTFTIPLTSVIFDILAWLVPVTMVLRLQFVEWRKKVVLLMLLGMGLLACVAAAMRLSIVQEIPSDESYEVAWMCIWTTVEIGTGIIAASIPALRPLLALFIARARARWAFGIVGGNDTPQPPVEEAHPSNVSAASTTRRTGSGVALDRILPRAVQRYESTEPLFPAGEMDHKKDSDDGGYLVDDIHIRIDSH